MVAVVAAPRVLALAATAAASPAIERAHPGISVPTAPAPAPFMATDERRHLVYEVAFENRTGARVRLLRMDVRDPSRRRAPATYRGAAVKQLMAGLAARPTRTFAPGEADVLLLDVSLPPGRRVPDELEHFRTCSTASGSTGASNGSRATRRPRPWDPHADPGNARGNIRSAAT